jgi:radical SAM protein with 4Fe4S-binding SPASM domain
MHATQFIQHAVRAVMPILPYRFGLEIVRLGARALNAVKYGDQWTFTQVFVEVYTPCNRACWYCQQKFKRDVKAHMTLETFDRILDGLREMKWRGGFGFHYLSEPLLDDRIPLLIARVRERLPAALPILFTNGDLLTEETVDRLVFSGLTRATITRHPPFSKAWDRRMAEIIRRWPRHFHIHQVDEVYQQAGQIEQLKGISQIDPQFQCVSTLCTLPIRYDGSVTVCCCDYERSVNMGNVNEKSIREIWTDPKFVAVRKALRTGQRLFSMCQGCDQGNVTNLFKRNHAVVTEEQSAAFQKESR